MSLENRIRYYKDRSVIAKASGLPTRMERIRAAGYRKVKVVDNSAESGIILDKSLRIPQVPSSIITKKIKIGEYNTKLSRQQYLKHIEGTAQYEKYKASRISKGGHPQSFLILNEDEVQKIINTKAGTGIVKVDNRGNPRPQELIVCDEIIGYYYGNGEYHETKKAAIHYGKNVRT